MALPAFAPASRRYLDAAYAVLLDRFRDQAAALDVVDELAQVLRSDGLGLLRPRGLLHAGDLAVEHARAGQLLRVRDEARFQAGEDVELVAREELIGGVEAFDAHELGFLQGAAQVKVVGAARGDRNAHAFAVDLPDRLDLRPRRNEERDRNLEVRLGERDLVCTLRLGAEKADI